MREVQDCVKLVVDWVRAPAKNEQGNCVKASGFRDEDAQNLKKLAALILSQTHVKFPKQIIRELSACGHVAIPWKVQHAFELLAEDNATDNFALLYSKIVAAENRRPLGTFFTPSTYAESMIREYVKKYSPPERVVDVGAGVGIFSELSLKYWKQSQVYSIDVNPVTLGLQAVAMAGNANYSANLVLSDYQTWLKEDSGSEPTLYLGNPPYTRWQLIPKESRSGLLEQSCGLVKPLANLSTLFFAMTLMKLRPADSLLMILPSSWMHARFAGELRSWLRTQEYRCISIRHADSWQFEDAIVDAVSVEIGPQTSKKKSFTMSGWDRQERVLIERGGADSRFVLGEARSIVHASNVHRIEFAKYARVSRGMATGANGFFIRSSAEWDQLEIDKSYRFPVVRRLRAAAGSREPLIDDAEVLCLSGYQRGTDHKVDMLLHDGELRALNERYLCSSRSSWFDLQAELRIPDVIVSSFARDRFHVVENRNRMAISNNLFGLYWCADVVESDRSLVLEWMRSDAGQQALRRCSSPEGRGLYRLSPRLLMQIPMGESERCDRLGVKAVG